MQYLDLYKHEITTSPTSTEWYLFGCGHNQFNRLKVDKGASAPSGNIIGVNVTNMGDYDDSSSSYDDSSYSYGSGYDASSLYVSMK